MRIQVVSDKDDLFGHRVQIIGSVPENVGKIHRRSCFCHDCVALSCKGLKDHKDIGNSIAFVDRIDLFRLSGATGNPDLFAINEQIQKGHKEALQDRIEASKGKMGPKPQVKKK